MRFFVAAILGLGFIVQGCHPSSPAGDESDTTAITNRPQTYDRFIALLKLKTPALLTTAVKVDGKVQVDAGLKDQILAEQDAMIAELAAISPDIKVIYRYKMVLNGLSIVAPKALEAQFRALASVSYVEGEAAFDRLAPVSESSVDPALAAELENNSVKFIGADKVHTDVKAPGTDGPTLGQGIKVGIIDTGIDYTHAMFGGAGVVDAYTGNDPTLVEDGSFPTAKVVGGIDLVGTAYDSNAPAFELHVPKPDADPLDEAGHGSHVAGTVAGLGNGTVTYSGVAPEASLYAIKVFGKDGSTGDAVIVAALEFASDPNGDLDPADHLDVVNLSLGSSFGTPHLLYQEAAANLIKGDTVMVASAGNSGANDYIVGAPSTADDALSVAASIDGMDHNWKFRAVSFTSAAHPQILAEAVEASWATPIATAGDVKGKLVYIGLANAELTPEQKAAVAGNVALIDRGAVTFYEKGKRAFDAGAIGVVVANNVEGAAFGMGGGDGTVLTIPAIMISKTLGDTLKADMAAGDALITFVTDQRIEKPELVDTLTDFSSRGPRSIDGALKPEIAAPGANVISAKMGSGDQAVQMSGTSMAAPHMTGVMALMKQVHPDLDVQALKALVMGTALQIHNAQGVAYPVAHMGAGRVQAFEAASAQLYAQPAALSLGEVLVEQAKVVSQKLTLNNLAAEAVTLTLKPELKAGLTMTAPATVTIAAKSSATVNLRIKIAPTTTADTSAELDGFLTVSGSTGTVRVPILAVVNRTTRVAAKELKVLATSAADSVGAVAELTLKNESQIAGTALPFNLLGTDERKEAARENPSRNGICDLESAGFRVIKKDVEGVTKDLLQVAVKLYNPVTSWHTCEISIQIDGDGDGIADQELLGTNMQTLSNNAAQLQAFASVLTDASKMRQIRKDYETAFPNGADPVYTPAITDAQDFETYGHSTISIVSADLALVKKAANGDVKIKLAVLADVTSPESDDFLGASDKWKTITPTVDGQAFVDLPESVQLGAGETQTVSFTKGGATRGDLVVYLPFNATTQSAVARDSQAKVLRAKYGL